MKLNILTDKNLDTQLSSLITSEKELLADIILHIREVDRRKLYLRLGYASLFSYLTESKGYASGSAQRRIDAARLSLDVPALITKIEAGEINLSHVSVLQHSIRQAQTESKTKLSKETKTELINHLSNKTLNESQVIVAQALSIEPKNATLAKHQRDESVRLEITLTKAQWQKLEKLREVLSFAVPSGSWDEVLEYSADEIIKLKDKARPRRQLKPSDLNSESKLNIPSKEVQSKADSSEINTAAIEDSTLEKPQASTTCENTNPPENPTLSTSRKNVRRAHIPSSVRRQILQRDGCCQYVDKATGRTCASTWKLSIDHIEPVWAGGGDELQNLRALCARHNQEMYRWQTSTVHR